MNSQNATSFFKENKQNIILYSDNDATPENDYLKVKRHERSNAFIKLENDPRITKIGHIIRKYSIDELPQLFNILKGDMSIIGPRPLLVSYLNYYTETERHRHDVRPGLTGLAQVNGRSFITWEEIFQYDLQYVSELTFGLDIKIVFLTIKKVFFRDDIADASTYEKDENGQLYVIADGKKFKVHSALNEERSYKMYANK